MLGTINIGTYATLTSYLMPKLGKKFGSHRFYASILDQDLDDPRTLTTLKELRS